MSRLRDLFPAGHGCAPPATRKLFFHLTPRLPQSAPVLSARPPVPQLRTLCLFPSLFCFSLSLALQSPVSLLHHHGLRCDSRQLPFSSAQPALEGVFRTQCLPHQPPNRPVYGQKRPSVNTTTLIPDPVAPSHTGIFVIKCLPFRSHKQEVSFEHCIASSAGRYIANAVEVIFKDPSHPLPVVLASTLSSRSLVHRICCIH